MTVYARFHGLALVAAGPEHVAAVIRDLRPRDRYEAEELERCTNGGLSVEERLKAGLAGSKPCLALIREADGETLALGGVMPLGSGSDSIGLCWGSPWMVGTSVLDTLPGATLRCLRKASALLAGRFVGLINFVLAPGGDAGNVRLLQHLGFTLTPITFARPLQAGDKAWVFHLTLNQGGSHVHADGSFFRPCAGHHWTAAG